jgi:hypothetical protein
MESPGSERGSIRPLITVGICGIVLLGWSIVCQPYFQRVHPERTKCVIDPNLTIEEMTASTPPGSDFIPKNFVIEKEWVVWSSKDFNYVYINPNKTRRNSRGVTYSDRAFCMVKGEDGQEWLIVRYSSRSNIKGYVPRQFAVINPGQ